MPRKTKVLLLYLQKNMKPHIKTNTPISVAVKKKNLKSSHKHSFLFLFSPFSPYFLSLILFFILCSSVFSFSALAQDLSRDKIRVYTKADGLPSNWIYCMDQDKDGNLWIGTWRGASKFDGKRFINYGAKDGFSDKQIWAILCDSKGNIWFETHEDGLFRFDGKNWEQFTKEKYGLYFNNFVNAFLYEDKKGNIWGGGGAYCAGNNNIFKYSKGTFEVFDLYSTGITENHQNDLLISDDTGTDNSLLKYIIKQNNKFELFGEIKEKICDVATDKSGNIWIATNTSIYKSSNLDMKFNKFQYDSDTIGNCLNMFIDNKNQIWTAHRYYLVRFDGSKFHYYDELNGLPEGFYYCIFQDKQGHLWVACYGGLAIFDNIPPEFKVSETIPRVIKTRKLSFSFTGNDGQFGSPAKDLTYEYRLANEKTWQKAENGQVKLNNLQDDTDYHIILRVTDGFENNVEKEVTVSVDNDTYPPTVNIINQDEFLRPLDKSELSLKIKGRDDGTPSEELLYRYKLLKKGSNIQAWQDQWNNFTDEVSLTNIPSGEYTFIIQVKDSAGKIGENKIDFTISPIADKPRILIEHVETCYFKEKNNRPIYECSKVKLDDKPISSGKISFPIKNIDTRPQKQNLEYSVWLEPFHQGWQDYSTKAQYEFPESSESIGSIDSELPDGDYTLKVRARDAEGFVSVIQEFKFTVKGADKLPQTKPESGENLSKGTIVNKTPLICWKNISGTQDNLFSYKLDNGDWSEFSSENCFEIPVLETGQHCLQVLSKNKFGIETSPYVFDFKYERIPDLPVIKLVQKPSKIMAANTARFTFYGEDDMEKGDKTPPEKLLYSWRLIPKDRGWQDFSSQKEASYTNLENGTYFFQVKARDKSENESVSIAEYSFEVRVIPFYKKPEFFWPAGFAVLVFAVSLTVFFTRRRVTQKVYDDRYNPYVVGEAVHDPDMFFGRDKMLKDIFQSLKGNSLCLTGERRIGKTSLLEHLEKNAEKPLFAFFCNLEGVKEELFFSRIMQHLINKIQAEFHEGPNDLTLFKKSKEAYDDVDFEDDIEKVLTWLKTNYDSEASIIMCLDEIDATLNFSNETHASLRNVFQTYQGKIRLVAAGVAIQRGDWKLPTSPWYNFFEFVEIKALDPEYAKKLVTKPVKGFYKFESSAVDLIISKTDFKPYYVQRICKTLIFKILDEERRIVKFDDVTGVYNNMIRLELNREFETFWEQLSKELRNQIIKAAKDKNTKLSKEQEAELMNNQYNHGHRVMVCRRGEILFSTIFMDWLEINY